MSCSDIGWITGVSAPPWATIRPLRAWSSGSKPGVSASGPAPQPSMWQCTRRGLPARRPARSRSQLVGRPGGPCSRAARRLGRTSAANASRPAASLRSMHTWSLSRLSAQYDAAATVRKSSPPGGSTLTTPRAEVLEHETAERPGEELGGVDDEHAVEWERGLCPRRTSGARSTVAVDGSSEPGVADSTAGSPGRGRPTVATGYRPAVSRWRPPSRSRPSRRAVCTGA